jgi:hypothetical protein
LSSAIQWVVAWLSQPSAGFHADAAWRIRRTALPPLESEGLMVFADDGDAFAATVENAKENEFDEITNEEFCTWEYAVLQHKTGARLGIHPPAGQRPPRTEEHVDTKVSKLQNNEEIPSRILRIHAERHWIL